MKVGIPKEIKNHEYRVGATPHYVRALCRCGSQVVIQKEAGTAIGFTNEMYEQAGAQLVDTAEEAYAADMVIKVKEPQASEYKLLKENQILFAYLHLAPDPIQTKALLDAGVIAIAYETVVDQYGRLPLLTPMSEVAGRISVQAGATALQMAHGGRGVLLGGVPGVKPANVVVIGGGVVGTNAARMALGLGANVTILDRSLDRLRQLDETFAFQMKTLYSTPETLSDLLPEADLVIGAVLIPGKSAPKLVSRELLTTMRKGAVVVDVAIDQGGCFETSKPTTHSDPLYVEEGVIHYCVTNMPGACARTSTEALTNATLPFALNIASKGYVQALLDDPYLLPGLNVHTGRVTNQPVAVDLGYEYVPPEQVLA